MLELPRKRLRTLIVSYLIGDVCNVVRARAQVIEPSSVVNQRVAGLLVILIVAEHKNNCRIIIIKLFPTGKTPLLSQPPTWRFFFIYTLLKHSWRKSADIFYNSHCISFPEKLT